MFELSKYTNHNIILDTYINGWSQRFIYRFETFQECRNDIEQGIGIQWSGYTVEVISYTIRAYEIIYYESWINLCGWPIINHN